METNTAPHAEKSSSRIADLNGQALAHQRKEIDAIDQEIMDLLNRRAVLALEIARWKAAGQLPDYAPEREKEIIDQLCQTNRGPLSAQALKLVFTEIISACRAVQQPLRVAFLGPQGTFSHMACLRRFGSSCELAPQASIIDVFDETERGHSQVAVVPVENSSEGGVGLTLDQFISSDLQVCGEIYVRVAHALISNEKDLKDVHTVYSHPQALGQCRGWLARNLPAAVQMECASTAAAAREAAQRPGCAAVGSQLLAEMHGLQILASDIQDNPRNMTRFLVLGRQACPPTGSDKTSLLFILSHQPGSLHRALGSLADRGINLTHIQSRPIKERPWEYAFFADFMGHREDEEVAEALRSLEQEVEFIKVLGSYPAGESVNGD